MQKQRFLQKLMKGIEQHSIGTKNLLFLKEKQFRDNKFEYLKAINTEVEDAPVEPKQPVIPGIKNADVEASQRETEFSPQEGGLNTSGERVKKVEHANVIQLKLEDYQKEQLKNFQEDLDKELITIEYKASKWFAKIMLVSVNKVK